MRKGMSGDGGNGWKLKEFSTVSTGYALGETTKLCPLQQTNSINKKK